MCYINCILSHLSKLITFNNKILCIVQILYKTKLIVHQLKNFTFIITRCLQATTAIYATVLHVTQLHKLQLLLLVHKCYYHKHLLPKIYYDYFQPNQCVYSYETRNKADLYLHSVNTIFGRRCIKFKGALFWNDLPDHIKNIRSISRS